MLNTNIAKVKLDITLVESKSNNPTLKVNQLFLHSKYDPIREGERIAQSSYKKNHLHILFGIGMGYIASALLDTLSETDRLLIVEPNSEVFEIMRQASPSQKLFGDDRVQIAVGDNIDLLEAQLNLYIQEFMGRFTVIESPNYAKLYPRVLKDVLSMTKDKLMMEIINNNTRHMFSERWQENYLSNLYNAFSAYNINELKGNMTLPVVIVAGGPSLTKQQPLLKRIKNRALIICAGSTINSLLQAEIRPDLVVSVDGGVPNYKHFQNLNINDIPLAYPLVVHKGIPSEHKGKQIVFNINDVPKLNELTEVLLSQKLGIVQTGHSVANFSFNIALQITKGPICLIGQDLAYTNNESHASGNRGFSVVDEKKGTQRKMVHAEGYHGDEVLTDYVFLGMKNGFENHLAQERHKGSIQEIFNCTEGGIKIEGFEQISFQSFVESYCQDDRMNEIHSILPDEKEISNEDWQHFRNQLGKLKVNYEEVINLTSDALDTLAEIEKGNYLFSTEDLEKLDEYDQKLKELLEDDFIFYIIKPILFKLQHSHLESENETEEESHKRIYNKSLLLYKGIKDTSEKGIFWLGELLNKIEKHL